MDKIFYVLLDSTIRGATYWICDKVSSYLEKKYQNWIQKEVHQKTVETVKQAHPMLEKEFKNDEDKSNGTKYLTSQVESININKLRDQYAEKISLSAKSLIDNFLAGIPK